LCLLKFDGDIQLSIRHLQFILNYSYSTSSRDLERHFSRYGRVEKVDLIIDNQGRSRGFGFITFDTVEVSRQNDLLKKTSMLDRVFFGYSRMQGKLVLP
jgi:RNA recognition motif-containing protein